MERLLTADEVAYRWGLDNPHSVYFLARSGELPFVRIGKRTMRFKAEDVDAYEESQRNKAFNLPTKAEREARNKTASTALRR